MANMTTKELNYLKDFLSAELLMAKKCKQYEDQEFDIKYKNVFGQAGQLHQQNYLKLIDYLAGANNSEGGAQ